MNKGRVEAFTDAVIAIIVTIMVLELKVPDGYTFSALLEEWPDFIAYAVSFSYIMVAWYNHHYMFGLTHTVTRKMFWANNLWIFMTSLYPVSTAWLGEDLDHWQPAMFYLIIYTLWAYVYTYLTHVIAQANAGTAVQGKILNMPIYKMLSSKYMALGLLIAFGLVYIYPPAVLILSILFLPVCMRLVSDDSDKLDQAKKDGAA
ncbi:TMEM175 family protein [Weissella viridescens]|nr:TMEM175 family protein [Weissella viridescens]